MEKKSRLTNPLVVMLGASLCCLLWGSAIPFINLGYGYFGIGGNDTATQILFAGCRFLIAGSLAILFECIAQKRFALPKRESWPNVLKLGLAQTVVQYVLFYIGVAHTSSVKGPILLGLHAFVTILVACYVFRSEKMNAEKWIGGIVGAAGVLVVTWTGQKLDLGMSFQGEGCLLISMFASACASGLIKKYSKNENPVVISGWQFFIGGSVMALAGFFMGGRLHTESVLGILVLVYLGALSAIAYSLWGVLLKVNPISRVAVYSFLQPIFGVLLGLLLVNQDAQVSLGRCVIALALVCLSIIIVGRGQRKDA